ncbi:MAG: serine hydrolase, partial [Synechococcales cyanobacterium T60_A2020_003]|nr:serine hydrolase [Synechococcales cyanobacterium T60_A2020_003]
PLRLVPRSASRRPEPASEIPKVRRSPSSAFTHRLGSMGVVADPTAAPRRPVSEAPRLPPPGASSKAPSTPQTRSRRDGPAPINPSASTKPSRSTPNALSEAQARRKPRKNSPLLYAVRTLILVVGVGAIAGTLLSTINPSGQVADASQQSASTPSSEVASADSSATGLGLANLWSTYNGRELSQLKQDILAMSDIYSGLTPGVFMLDLDTGNTIDINGDVSFAAASMIKVPVLVAFFQEVDAGRIQLDEMLTMEEADVASGSGNMQFSGVGTQYTALETATLMIIISDNTATNMLIRRMGGIEAVNERFRSWGLQTTVIRNVLPDLEGTNTTTPKELAGLMTMVSNGDLLSIRSRDRMLDIMRRTHTATLIPTGVGDPDATIAHKTGDIGELVGDVGLVDMPNGKRYAITTLMKRSFNDDRAQEWIRQINSMIYQELLKNPTPDLFDTPISPSESVDSEGLTETDVEDSTLDESESGTQTEPDVDETGNSR